METLEEKLAAKAEPLLAEMGLELVDLELGRQGQRLLVRLFIDRRDRSRGGVSVDECGGFNLAFGQLLEVEDLIASGYVLEVSSPGLNRRVRKLDDFKRFIGETVSLTSREKIEGRRHFKGELVEADEAGITLEANGERMVIAHSLIARACLERFEG